ncbi:MAG: endonuclease/exonuclease/phosphatase family protein [Bacteroidota bacterium]
MPSVNSLRFCLRILLVLWPAGLLGQSFTIVSWNIQDLGRSKDARELGRMAEILKDYDLIAIQEVVAKDPAGAKAVAQLADLLNRSGANWDYRISDPTRSPSPYISERYAFLWKKRAFRLKSPPRLDTQLAERCFREPYLAKFMHLKSQQAFWLVNFHARKHDQQPEIEINALSEMPGRFAEAPLILAGDFNVYQQDKIWQIFYNQHYQSALHKIPTTLKRKCSKGQYFLHPIDNILFPDAFHKVSAERIDFVQDCRSLSAARGLSDHAPVMVQLEAKD